MPLSSQPLDGIRRTEAQDVHTLEPSKYHDVTERLIGELNSESDRTLAIAGAAYLESLLARILKESSSDEDRYDIDPETGMRFSFRNLIKKAHDERLLSGHARYLLNKIKYVRNYFAHEMFCSFDDDKIRDECLKLDLKLQYDTGLERDARHRFAVHVFHLFNMMWIALDDEDNLDILTKL